MVEPSKASILEKNACFFLALIEFMVKPVVTEVRKINSNLSQKFHSVFVAVAAEAGFGTYLVIDIIFEFLDRCRIFNITV